MTELSRHLVRRCPRHKPRREALAGCRNRCNRPGDPHIFTGAVPLTAFTSSRVLPAQFDLGLPVAPSCRRSRPVWRRMRRIGAPGRRGRPPPAAVFWPTCRRQARVSIACPLSWLPAVVALSGRQRRPVRFQARISPTAVCGPADRYSLSPDQAGRAPFSPPACKRGWRTAARPAARSFPRHHPDSTAPGKNRYGRWSRTSAPCRPGNRPSGPEVRS